MPPSLKGSTTATIAILDGDLLRVANLGDSRVLALRHIDGLWNIVLKTREQQHYFNCPYQLGTGSPDRPAHAELSAVRVQEGDVLVITTDGVHDNLFDADVVRCLVGTDVAAAAKCIAMAAYAASKNHSVLTPFSVNSGAEGYVYHGGKPDDITCLVAIVTHGGP